MPYVVLERKGNENWTEYLNLCTICTHDSIEFCGNESNSRLFCDFCEQLVINLDVTDSHRVLAHESRASAASIADRKCGSVLHIVSALLAVVFGMQVARKLENSTLGAWNPKVGGSSVRDDLQKKSL